MKKFILFFVLCLVSPIAYADSYLIYNTTTKEVYSLSNEDDAVMPQSGYKKVILKDDLTDIQLEYSAEYYKYLNNKFVKNISKISSEEEQRVSNEEKENEEILIQKRIRKIAIEQLKSEGVILKYQEE